MKKILLIPLLFICFFVKAQTPVNVSQPQKFLKRIYVEGAILADSAMANSDSSKMVPNSAWIKRLISTGATYTAGYGLGLTAFQFRSDSTVNVNFTRFNTVIPTATLARINTKQNALGFTPENVANKQNSLTTDGTGVKYPTVDAVNTGLALKANNTLPNGLVSTIPSSTNSMVILADSFFGGTGASTFQNGLGWSVPRSILNATDRGFPNDRGEGYHTFINMYNLFFANFGASTNGSFINSGISSSRLVLTAGQFVKITNVAINFADIIYNGSNSSGTLQIKINGNLVQTRTLSGTGLQNTLDGSMITGVARCTALSDTISITATGTAEIAGLEFEKNTFTSPFIYVSSQGGTSIQDYSTTAALDEIAFYLNTQPPGTTANKFMAIALGTNTLYYAPKSLTPSAYITALQTFITGINSRATNVQYIITVPAKSNESVYPIIAAGYTYQDYVKAIVDFATTNGYALVRYDLTQMGTGNTAYLADNEHPNNAGYTILASAWGSTLGIRPNSSLPLEKINAVDGSTFFPQTASLSNSLVLRDVNGNFSAGIITAALTGNASTATNLATGRTIGITGDGTYTSPSFNGSTNVTAAFTLAIVNANTGSFGTASNVPTYTVNGKGLLTASANTPIQISESQVTNLVTDLAAKQASIPFGAGVQPALAVNIGSAGAPILFNGVAGTPSSIGLANATGTASALSIGGTASNITAYTINQNLGTANSPRFASGSGITGSNPGALTWDITNNNNSSSFFIWQNGASGAGVTNWANNSVLEGSNSVVFGAIGGQFYWQHNRVGIASLDGSGNFGTSGNISAPTGTFSGNLTAAGIQGTTGNFSGNISSSALIGALTLQAAANITAGTTITPGVFTVALLPIGQPVGALAYVTDALSPSYNATVVGGGSVRIPVFYNGTNWTAH